jgi:osmoprotectant transport system permease protein
MTYAVTEATAEAPTTPRTRSLGGYLALPVVLLIVLLVLYLTVREHPLDSIEQRLLNPSVLAHATVRHLQLTAVSTLLVLIIAIPVGILMTRPAAAKITMPAIAVFNIGQAIPSIGLVVIFAIVWDIGFWPTIVALVAYSILPVLRNTMIGLRQVDASVIESGRGMGMSKLGVLTQIELPLAIPVIVTGLRTALVINVGTATLGTFVAAGGLGDIINGGLVQNRTLVTVVGSVLTAVLALLIDYLAGIAEDLLRPRGL